MKLINYVRINGLILIVGTLTYLLDSNSRYLAIVIRHLSFLVWFSIVISKNTRHSNEFELWLRLFFFVCPMEYICLSFISPAKNLESSFYFLWKSFIFELAFDFGHYWMHRACHQSKQLYQLIHRTHHRYIQPTPLTTYSQSFLDLIVTNMLPFYFATFFVEFSALKWHWIFAYKTYIEIAGHTGSQTSKSPSFPQFPLLGGLALTTRDHTNHLRFFTVNYSKRFRIWDQLFRTFKKI